VSSDYQYRSTEEYRPGFVDAQIDELRHPLEQDRVKYRKQAGRQIAYLEGYDAIDRANAIFGFDGWNYRTSDLTLVRIGEIAFYQACVTVEVAGVSRQDYGTSDVAFPRDKIIDDATADAYATALKGAVTDGLKRALRTFGAQFGNSLYDKDDPSHTHEAQEHPPAQGSPSPNQERQACPTCGVYMTLRSGTTKDGRPYTGWFCGEKCGQKPLWLNK
jgi:DNA repair and recombination protein RAD52